MSAELPQSWVSRRVLLLCDFDSIGGDDADGIDAGQSHDHDATAAVSGFDTVDLLVKLVDIEIRDLARWLQLAYTCVYEDDVT